MPTMRCAVREKRRREKTRPARAGVGARPERGMMCELVRNSQDDAFQVIPVAPLLTYPLSWLKPVTRPPVDTAVSWPLRRAVVFGVSHS